MNIRVQVTITNYNCADGIQEQFHGRLISIVSDADCSDGGGVIYTIIKDHKGELAQIRPSLLVKVAALPDG